MLLLLLLFLSGIQPLLLPGQQCDTHEFLMLLFKKIFFTAMQT